MLDLKVMEIGNTSVKGDDGEEFLVDAGGLVESEEVITHRYAYDFLQFLDHDPEDTWVWEITYSVKQIMGEFYLHEADIQIEGGEDEEGWESGHAKVVEHLKELCEKHGVTFVPKPKEQPNAD